MATQLLATYLKSVCKKTPDPAVDKQSTTSAVIFFSYIGFALLLTGSIISFLFHAYQALLSRADGSRIFIRQLAIRCFLVTTSFAVLSYHMLLFLVDSYTKWARTREVDVLSGQSGGFLWRDLYLWEWATRIPLFTVFANDVFKVKEADLVILLALAWEMMMAVSITANGRQRRIPYLWCYIFLAQILPISFIQNLFEIARLLSDTAQFQASRPREDQPQAESKSVQVANKNQWELLEGHQSYDAGCSSDSSIIADAIYNLNDCRYIEAHVSQTIETGCFVDAGSGYFTSVAMPLAQ